MHFFALSSLRTNEVLITELMANNRIMHLVNKDTVVVIIGICKRF